MCRNRVRLALLPIAILLGCSSDPSTDPNADCVDLAPEQLATSTRPECPNDLPSESACNDAVPSYQTTIASVVSQRCGSCHGPGGMEASLPFSTYKDLYAQRREALSQVFGCQMPPVCALDLSSDERAALLKWFVCGALDN